MGFFGDLNKNTTSLVVAVSIVETPVMLIFFDTKNGSPPMIAKISLTFTYLSVQ